MRGGLGFREDGSGPKHLQCDCSPQKLQFDPWALKPSLKRDLSSEGEDKALRFHGADMNRSISGPSLSTGRPNVSSRIEDSSFRFVEREGSSLDRVDSRVRTSLRRKVCLAKNENVEVLFGVASRLPIQASPTWEALCPRMHPRPCLRPSFVFAHGMGSTPASLIIQRPLLSKTQQH